MEILARCALCITCLTDSLTVSLHNKHRGKVCQSSFLGLHVWVYIPTTYECVSVYPVSVFYLCVTMMHGSAMSACMSVHIVKCVH